MIRLHIGKKRQTTFPKILCDWIGVEPGGDISVHLEKGKIVFQRPQSGAGMLAKYVKKAVNDRRTNDEIASHYAAASDERVQRQAARRRRA